MLRLFFKTSVLRNYLFDDIPGEKILCRKFGSKPYWKKLPYVIF